MQKSKQPVMLGTIEVNRQFMVLGNNTLYRVLTEIVSRKEPTLGNRLCVNLDNLKGEYLPSHTSVIPVAR